MSDNTGLTRYDADTSTCGTEFKNFFSGFFGKFQDSFCYTFVLQCIVVSLMYMNVGRGKYWKILHYAAIAGLCGSILENATVAVICTEGNRSKAYKPAITFLIDELFWIPCEFSIPYLNLIKMKAFAKGKLANGIRYVIYTLTFPFVFFRLCIGYTRMKRGYLQDKDIHAYHGYAFAVMAIADIICTFAILYFVRKANGQVAMKTSNINDFVKHSSYTILLTVDVVSALLSISNIISNVGPFSKTFPNELVTPFHCLKCSFILILAADALIFKYGANVSSNHASSGNVSKSYGTGSESYNYGTKSASYKSRICYQNDITNSNLSKNRNMSNISPNVYPNNDDFTKSSDSMLSNSRSIIKNYTNNGSYDNSDDKTIEVKVYPTQSFGFLNNLNKLNQQQKY